MKKSAKKAGSTKPYKIFSENEKMDTSGMAGKPVQLDLFMDYEPPKMPLRMMMAQANETKSKK
jgi:hypothetical protein